MNLAPVLLIEDNLDDVELTRLAFAEAGIAHPLVVAPDGARALDWLREHSGNDAGHELPALVLIDLNLPKLDGREVMRAIRADAAAPARAGVPRVARRSGSGDGVPPPSRRAGEDRRRLMGQRAPGVSGASSHCARRRRTSSMKRTKSTGFCR